MIGPMRFHATMLATVLATALASSGAARGEMIALSTDTAAPGSTLGGVTFSNGTVVRYDTVAGTATTIFAEANFTGSENIDAFDLLPNGHMILSTISTATLGGITFSDGSLVEWDPVNLTASLFFDETTFDGAGSNKNIDAVSVLPNGHILISTEGSHSLGGLSFLNGDVVEWDPVNLTASIFFSEALFGGANIDIDAFDVDASGMILLSTRENNVTLGGITFNNGDVVLYDPVSGTASILLAEASAFSKNEDVDAVAFAAPVPEPGTASLLGLGLAGLGFAGRKRSAQR
jgi:hypothetical protein